MTPEHPIDLGAVRSPKLTGGSAAMWYRYYAGFSTDFVKDLGNALGVNESSRVLDPWMGSGTTLGIAASKHALVDGLDLNPAMAVIAKGRLVAVDTEGSIDPLLTQISQHWRAAQSVSRDDALTCWFDQSSVSRIRGLIARIDDVLIGSAGGPVEKASVMSSIAAFYYVAAFRTVTRLLKGFSSRNPTWVKKNKPGDGFIELTGTDLSAQFEESARYLAAFVRYRKQIPSDVRDLCHVVVGDSRHQPFESASFDAVITSPPYLTRLDYVIGHLPELAVLGLTNEQVSSLRESMIGTPTITSVGLQSRLSEKPSEIVERIASHDSYAASSYYAKNVRQYFAGMSDSIAELRRVTKSGGRAALVVQDSHFKDIHLDLAAAISDQAAQLGWSELGRKDFINIRSMASVNTRAHEKARTTKPTETVLVLQAS